MALRGFFVQQQVLNATSQEGNEVLFGIFVERFNNLHFRLNHFKRLVSIFAVTKYLPWQMNCLYSFQMNLSVMYLCSSTFPLKWWIIQKSLFTLFKTFSFFSPAPNFSWQQDWSCWVMVAGQIRFPKKNGFKSLQLKIEIWFPWINVESIVDENYNIAITMSLCWATVFKYLIQCHCPDWGYLNIYFSVTALAWGI